MTAMGVNRFVVTLKHAAEDKQEERYWYKDEVMHGMAWLKRMNARGYDVLIRPDNAHGLVLLDGLSKAQLDTLRQLGFGPTVVVDIDRERYEAWIKLSDGPIPGHVRERAVRGLKKGLGLPNRIEASAKDSRLAGLTNRSVNLKKNQAPYTLLIEAVCKVAPAAQTYLQQIQLEMAKEISQRGRQRDNSQGRPR